MDAHLRGQPPPAARHALVPCRGGRRRAGRDGLRRSPHHLGGPEGGRVHRYRHHGALALCGGDRVGSDAGVGRLAANDGRGADAGRGPAGRGHAGWDDPGLRRRGILDAGVRRRRAVWSRAARPGAGHHGVPHLPHHLPGRLRECLPRRRAAAPGVPGRGRPRAECAAHWRLLLRSRRRDGVGLHPLDAPGGHAVHAAREDDAHGGRPALRSHITPHPPPPRDRRRQRGSRGRSRAARVLRARQPARSAAGDVLGVWAGIGGRRRDVGRRDEAHQ